LHNLSSPFEGEDRACPERSRRSEGVSREMALNLTEKQKVTISQYLEILHKKYRNIILQVILFGSAARGELDEESDIDILVILKNGDNKLRDEISMASFEMILNNNVILSPIVMDKKTFEWHKRYKDPLYNSIKRDGINLWMKKQLKR
jgi:predicted nucleotidyltransferase